MLTDDEKKAIEQVADALQVAVMLAARVRARMGEQFHEMIQCEAAVGRAAAALTRFHPKDR